MDDEGRARAEDPRDLGDEAVAGGGVGQEGRRQDAVDRGVGGAHAVDPLGRHGVAIARQNDTDGQRTEWIFDKKTLQLLGERVVVVKAKAGDLLKVGTVTHTSAITERAVVDAAKQLPGQAS